MREKYRRKYYKQATSIDKARSSYIINGVVARLNLNKVTIGFIGTQYKENEHSPSTLPSIKKTLRISNPRKA